MGMSGDDALALAKAYTRKSLEGAGALKGDDGFSPIITENPDNTKDIYKLDITTKDGTFTTPNLKGYVGADGFSPTATVTKDGNITTITLTDKNGTTSEMVLDGETNIIESVTVNGVAVPIVDKTVNIDLTDYVEKEDGKTLISTSDVAQIAQNKADITTLNGTGEGSVDKKIADKLSEQTYLTKEIATADEIASYIADPSTAKFNVIYLVKDESATGADKYFEYQRIGNEESSEFVMTGDTSTDLTDYAKMADVDNKIESAKDEVSVYAKNYTDTQVGIINTELGSKADKSEAKISAEITDRIYEGADLTVRFADEIANYTDEWAWIKARITNGNFEGIHVCDYIPITCTNGYVLNAQVAGINTYKGYGDTAVGNHIDFICKELWNDLHVMNKINYNNGNANSPNPFLASDLNYWLNSMAGSVPNSTSDGTVLVDVDYTTSGILYYMPDEVKNQIITKRVLLPSRYSEGSVLTDDNSWAWQSTGKLWIPSEVEVAGTAVWGNTGYGAGGFVQYPIFANNMNRAKRRCSSADRCYWWLLSAYAGNSTHFTYVNHYGTCNYSSAAYTSVAAPVCFRI